MQDIIIPSPKKSFSTKKIIRSSKRVLYWRLTIMTVILANLAFLPFNVTFAPAMAAGAVVNASITPWWPISGAAIQGVQPFKAAVAGLDPNQYEMFWYVDGGTWNWMDNNYTDAPHKESRVDVSGWTWRGAGPYQVSFVARKDGVIIGQTTLSITVGSAAALPAAPAASTVVATTQSVPQALTFNAPTPSLSDSSFYVAMNTPAARQANEWRQSRPSDAAKMDLLAAQPTAQWLGGWSGDVRSAAQQTAGAAAGQGKTALFVAYNIPGRDCGGYSAGGANNGGDYLNWVRGIAAGIGSLKALVVLEPDGLSTINCLSPQQKTERLDLLKQAVGILKGNANTAVYLDAGHSNWIDAGTMASLLQQAGIDRADGFALNVSNFMTTADETAYGQQVSQKSGGKHFVIDTARNGSGSSGEWCNPSGRTIGSKPTTGTGSGSVDAYLWLKTPGESDGNCNGGPSAGQWWPEYALNLVR